MERGIGFLIEIFRASELGRELISRVYHNESRNESLVAHVRRWHATAIRNLHIACALLRGTLITREEETDEDVRWSCIKSGSLPARNASRVSPRIRKERSYGETCLAHVRSIVDLDDGSKEIPMPNEPRVLFRAASILFSVWLTQAVLAFGLKNGTTRATRNHPLPGNIQRFVDLSWDYRYVQPYV